MADWIGSSRSNYFKVKDLEKFKEFCKKWNIHFWEGIFVMAKYEGKEFPRRLNPQDKPDQEIIAKGNTFTLYAIEGNDDFGGWTNVLFDDEGEEIANYDDFLKELSTHLEEGWVAVLIEVGSEKLAYLTGCAQAVNWKGEMKGMYLDQIMDKAKELMDKSVNKIVTEPNN